MYKIFDAQTPGQRAQILLPEFLYNRQGFIREKEKVLTYYQEFPRYTRPDHILSRIINSLAVSFGDDDYYFLRAVADQSIATSRALGLTSGVSAGRMFTGEFYGSGSSEVLVYTSDDFDLKTPWTRLEPVKVLRHDSKDLSLPLLNGHVSGYDGNVAVIAINVPMLAYQYRAWRIDQRLRPGAEGSDQTITQFIASYPIPNMLHSHLDIALFNRFTQMEHSNTAERKGRDHSFLVVDYTRKQDTYDTKLRRLINSRTFTFEEVLRAMPAVDKNNYGEVLRCPDVPYVRQVKWALTLARLPHILWLLKWARVSDSYAANGHVINYLKRSVARYENDRVAVQGMPPALQRRYNDMLGEVRSLL